MNQYGNDPINWIAGGWPGTPGQANVPIDKSAPSAPADLTGHVTVDPDKITLTWTAAVDHESYVDHYVVYRDGSVLGTATTTSYADVAVVPLTPYSYEVSAVNRDGYEGMRSAAAVVTVPGIANYAIPDASHIEMTFTEALTPATATVLGNYVFVGGSAQQRGALRRRTEGDAQHHPTARDRQLLLRDDPRASPRSRATNCATASGLRSPMPRRATATSCASTGPASAARLSAT